MNFFSALMEQERAMRILERLKSERTLAKDKNSDHCLQCGYCCWARPCHVMPEDIEPIAAFLGITPKELFSQYLVVDSIRGTLGVLPRRKTQDDIAGQYVPDERTYDYDSACVFLTDDNKCQIFTVQPKGARDFMCNGPGLDTLEQYAWEEAAIEALGWDGVRDDW